MDRCFNKACRLLKKEEFKSVFESVRDKRRGKMLRDEEFVVYWRYTEAPARLGISLSKKYIRRANKRNRVKRVLREFFRLNRAHLKGDFIVRCTASPKDYRFDSISEPMRPILENMKNV